MIGFFPAILSLIIGAAGWYYMFYSRAAEKLSGIEGESANRRRVRLRRANGLAMFLLAVALCAGFYSFDPKVSPMPFVATWVTVFILLVIIMVLGLWDIFLTKRLRRKHSDGSQT